MPWVLGGLSPAVRGELQRPIPSPCGEEDRRIYSELQIKLDLNRERSFEQSLKPTVENCHAPTTALEILSRGFVDDPDQGMDRDLPSSADPHGDRAWMGGTHGSTSQGFRHMFFGGWSFAHPLETFQIPFHAVGQAPERAQIMADASRELFREGKEAWAWRVLAWELHYLQDLTQPFHAVEILDPRMIPWTHIGHFVAESTRAIVNYHWAYESLVLTELRAEGASPLKTCLKEPVSSATFDPSVFDSEHNLALGIAHASVEGGKALGQALVAEFGSRLKDSGVDLPDNQGVPDYLRMVREDSTTLQNLDRQTCHALANAILVSQRIIVQLAGPKK
jgi:hypothetical protein